MLPQSLKFSFSANYYVLGDSSQAKQVWFVLHGYGQLAAYFIRNFSELQQHDVAIVAPEGLSNFYLEDTMSRMRTGNDRVGASWMTKHNRETDIENYLQYLNAVYSKISSWKTRPSITVLGFSQGAATASRWVLDGAIEFDKLVLWAGIFPPDIDFSKGKKLLTDKQTVLVYGTKDPFLHDNRFAEMKTLSEKLGIEPTKIMFEGAHEIHPPTLAKLI